MTPFLKETAEGVLLSVKLQPRASRTEIGGVMGEELRIKVTAPPVDSAANEALLEFLAGKLACAKGAVSLIRGKTSRHKTVLIRGMTAAAVENRLRL